MGNIFYNQVGGDKFWLRVEEMSGEWWGAFGFKPKSAKTLVK